MQFIEGQNLGAVINDLKRLAGRNQGEEGPNGAPAESHADIAEGSTQLAAANTPAAATTPWEPVPFRTEAATPSSVLLSDKESTQPWSQPTQSGDSTQTPAFFRTVARLGVQAAEALEHAHGLGVLHRDVKPGNLLVDLRGNLWVTDFGLAQIQGDAKLTMTGDLLGTIRYMSPEQALAKRVVVDQRTDIYSLGATLYELLTLEPVFSGRDRQEVLRQIAFEEPRLPKRINKAIPLELQTIVLKALAKNPAERYGTAQELAEDLERFLKDEPIHAKPPNLVQKTMKWARRHQPLVWSGGAAAILVALVVLAGLAVGYVLQAQAKDSIKNERDEATRQRDLAQENFQKAREAVDTYLTQVSEEQLLNQPGMQPLRERLLNSALHYYQDFAQQHGDDPSLKKELAEAYRRMGDIIALRSKPDAEEPLQKAIDAFEALRQANPNDVEVRSGLAKSYQSLAYVRVFGKQPVRAEEPARQAIALLEDLQKQNPESTDHGRRLGRSYDLLGQSLRVQGLYPEAKVAGRKAILVLETTAAQAPGDLEAKRLLATAYSNLSISLQLTGDREEQEEALHRAERVLDNSRFRLESAQAKGALGQLYCEQGRVTKAEEPMRKAAELLDSLSRENPTITQYRRWRALSLGRLGEIHMAKGLTRPAKTYLKQAIALQEEALRPEPGIEQESIGVAWWYYRLGGLEAELGRRTEGLQWSEKARDTQVTPVKQNPQSLDYWSDFLWSREQIIRLEVDENRSSAAAHIAAQLQIVNERRDLAQKSPNHSQWQFELAEGSVRLAELHLLADMPGTAQVPLDQALTILERVARAEPFNYAYRRFYAYALAVQSRMQTQSGDASAALRSARQAVAIVEKLVSEDSAYFFDLACHRACCSSLAGLGKKEPTPEETAESLKYASASVEALRQAIALGYDNLYMLTTDPCLAALRSREDFKTLTQKLQEKLDKESK
jgi:tetratricopeptide (TPR) repeat protein